LTRPQSVRRFLLIAVPAMAVLCGFVYFPHDAHSVAGRALTAYVTFVATMAGEVLHVLDGAVTVNGNLIGGRFPLSIILDCSALDAQALYLAAVLGIRARWVDKLGGIVGGLALITALNLARIATLYFVGARAPRLFHVFHEEIMQLAIVIGAVVTFGLWAFWATARLARARGGDHAPTTVAT
jgi:exosortase/archaeosortase family protein